MKHRGQSNLKRAVGNRHNLREGLKNKPIINILREIRQNTIKGAENKKRAFINKNPNRKVGKKTKEAEEDSKNKIIERK